MKKVKYYKKDIEDLRNTTRHILTNKYFNLFKTIAYANVFIIGIEIIQLVFRLGIFDVLDIILNILGVLVGFISYRLWSWYLWRRRMMMD